MNAIGYTIAPNQTVSFLASFPGASAVQLAGDFTSWEREPLSLRKRHDGLWFVTTPPLPVGVHFYKYIVDGAWCVDEAHSDRRSDGFGGYNSTFFISPKGLDLGGMNALRIASLNLHTYQEEEALAKLATTAEIFAALDIHAAALQEVGQNRLYPARQPNAGELLKKRLEKITGVPWYHEWRFAHVGFDIYDEGISLLSRVPLSEVRELSLGGRTYRRVAVCARLEAAAPLWLCSAHTSWPSDGGEEEIDTLLRSLPEGSQLVAGDFNAPPYAATITKMKQANFQEIGAAFKCTEKTFLGGHGPAAARIDYHFLRSTRWRAVGFIPIFDGESIDGIAQPWVSDHTGLLGAYEAV